MANAVYTIKHGVLKIKDSAGTAITVNLLEGGFKCQLKNQPHIPIRDRGTLSQWMHGDQEPLDFSLSVKVNSVRGPASGSAFSDMSVAEAFGLANNNSITLSATSASASTTPGSPNSVNMELTITNPAGSGPTTEVITLGQAVCDVIEFEEGYPDMLTINGKALSITPTTT